MEVENRIIIFHFVYHSPRRTRSLLHDCISYYMTFVSSWQMGEWAHTTFRNLLINASFSLCRCVLSGIRQIELVKNFSIYWKMRTLWANVNSWGPILDLKMFYGDLISALLSKINIIYREMQHEIYFKVLAMQFRHCCFINLSAFPTMSTFPDLKNYWKCPRPEILPKKVLKNA